MNTNLLTLLFVVNYSNEHINTLCSNTQSYFVLQKWHM
jgi:hypothetical protein